MDVHPVPSLDSSHKTQASDCRNGFVNEMVKGDHVSSPSEEEMECKEAVVTVTKGVAQRVQKIVSESASVERRSSARLRNRPDNKRPYYGTSSSGDVKDKGSRKNTKLHKRRELENHVVEEAESCKTCPVVERSGEVMAYADAIRVDSVDQTPDEERAERGDRNPADAVGKSDYARVKETLRIFNTHYLHFVQEEEKRCRKAEVDAKKVARGSKSESVQQGNASEEDAKRSSKRPDLKAISKMMETNAVLYRGKRFGDLPGINVGYQFFSRAEMVAIGFHSHWLNGIDYMGQSYSKLKEYSGYTFPLAVAIVLSGQYEDDLDNSEDVVYTGQGGNNLLGNKRQIQDQVMLRGNLALKNSLEHCVPVRVVRGHESTSSYCGKVYTYDGLYKVVQYWAEKGVSGFTVFKYRLRRLEGQPVLTTNQVHYARVHVPNSLSELRGLVSSDISGGLEDIPIPATNLVDDPPVAPEGLTYTKSIQVAETVKLPISAPGCSCKGTCIDTKTCACARLNGSDFPYVRRDGGRLIEAKAVVFECGPNCGCGPGCINRTSQRGLKYRFEVFRTAKKGWAVRSWDSIPSGAPVCEYTGILMRTDDLDSVCENNFIFDIDCLQTMKGLDGRERRLGDVSIPTYHLDTIDDKKSENVPEFCIDAGSVGNVARFINHSCEPNLFVQCVLSTHHDIKLARVVLFAADNIPPLQELTYDYGYAIDSVIRPDGNIKKMPCYCGAAGCRKRLY
ncbi:histone-lysine N-methyltransferase, H3 lysine-9 specific SUVH4-like isoform X1 [Telopea speciosissima]|uniref:histone-lysine N-methyltransferase, H3 lysine-9 specific SUVH4-like isoform X1 n=1 Tax=Telopea speciosissima TaxID=54955 RepID=UPI001CC44E93|nr:histone-lysine N-methyltransferase, H3 lysine-9 specific SUVH4-like isoform X1 [Telopea speciosissima]